MSDRLISSSRGGRVSNSLLVSGSTMRQNCAWPPTVSFTHDRPGHCERQALIFEGSVSLE